MSFGTDILAQAEALARFTEVEGEITRSYGTAAHRRAGEYLIALMREAGMVADFDALGNVVGRYAAGLPDAPVVMSGSHMDSVRNAGRYDGLFGILSAIACVRDLHRRGRRLPYTLEVIAFADEEGVRFGVTMLGSKAMAGSFDAAWLDCTDADGVTLREAIRAFGGDPEGVSALSRRSGLYGEVIAYVESHIEQGPILLEEGLPVGVVTSIVGTTRMNVRVTGLAGHAGTVPMGRRQDALAAAAEMVLAVERYALQHPGLVATVGKLTVAPGAVNVIPGEVVFTVDLRSGEDAVRRSAVEALREQFFAMAARRGVRVVAEPFFELEAAPCDPGLQAALARAIEAQGLPVRRLASGAGHDAMAFHGLCPIGMLFVRCGHGGISHHPSETMSTEDADLATRVLLHFFEHFEPPMSRPERAQRVEREGPLL
ncbi:MAG: allantoate amidohydrolase [Casimicrobiaceae bacterium]|nr:allantoate amidohydrolase [Casimicrobiaceae bacterium]MCX8099242.1 allantoate amidohydrolase [Casimicrobiaceae bacterium]MDW8312765.1 allantoate amidohydrolase [Burkholderiales bacterium]